MRLANLGLLASSLASAVALHVPFRRAQAISPAVAPIRFHKRQTNKASDPFGFTNLQDNLYVGTVIVDGITFEVQLDTGSSDLWVDSTGITFPSAQNTNVSTSITYGDQTVASGPILVSNVTFGNWSVPKQAFINAPGTNATSSGDKGLLGLGPPALSVVYQALNGSHYDGSPFLDRVFNARPDLPDQITFSLTRDESYGTTAGGFFTISTIAPGFESIVNRPKLQVADPAQARWTTAINGAIANGTLYGGGSQSEGLLIANLDTGTTAATAPKSYVDAFYSKSPGAVYDNSSGTWTVSCDAVFNVSLIFGNEKYFIHPIDMTEVDHITDDGTPVCTGVFTVDPTGFLLGDSFLRNVYSLFDFGNWTSGGKGSPFMQILSVTDEAKAFPEFQSLNNQRIAAAIQQQSKSSVGPTSSSSSSPTSTSNVPPSAGKDLSGAVANDSSSTVDLSGLNRDLYIIMGMVGVAIILLLVNLVIGFRKNQGYKQINAPGSAPPSHVVDKSYDANKSYSTPYED